MKKRSIILGAHEFITGGIDQAYYKAASINCTAVQFFTHSCRQWAMKPFTKELIDAVKKAQHDTGIKHTVVHSSYLVNLASTSKDVLKKSLDCLQKELEHCDQLGIEYLVMHPGGGNSDHDLSVSLISDGLTELFDTVKTKSKILLETMAGQGTQVGYRFEQLAKIRDTTKHKKNVGFCLDTCHVWAAGYDISTKKAYHEVMKECNDLLGFENIKAIHMNDSKQKLGSRVDRHAHIGKGAIGLEAFRLIMNDENFASIAKICETPRETLEDDARNVNTLLSLCK